MKHLRAWLRRLVGVVPNDEPDREFSEELESHSQMHLDHNLRSGMSPDEARRDALLKLGAVEQAYREPQLLR